MSTRSPHPYARRGISLAATVVMAPVLFGFVAFAVDVGYMTALRGEMQNTADAASLAGCTAIWESEYDTYEARALTVIEDNQGHQGYLALGDQTVEIGRWDKAAKTFTVVAPADITTANSVRVLSVRNNAGLFFGRFLGKTSTNVSREAVAMITPDCGGVWGLNSVTVPGNASIDSYDSTAGAYSAGSARSNGDVCSNGNIDISGSADIQGDVRAETITLTGGALTISGFTEDATETTYAPTIDFGDVATNNDNGAIPLTGKGNGPLNSDDQLIINGDDTLTLLPGTYYFTYLQLTASATITLTGPTTIYLAGNLDTDGSSVINTTMNTEDLTVFSTGTSIHLDGNSAFYGSIYAPDALVELRGNADYYGSLIGGDIEMSGNFSFHVDESNGLVQTLKGRPVLVK